MTRHLLLVSLGPVQDFIRSARRCQDLWYGSWLLSALSRSAAEAIEASVGADALVFPGALGNDKAAIANKILAVVPDTTDPEIVAVSAGEAMQTRLMGLAEVLFDRLPKTGWNREVAEAQVAGLMEYFWAAVPMPAGPKAYSEARGAVEALLASRKNTRVWAPPDWVQEPGQPKSALDGARESVLSEDLFGKRFGKTGKPVDWLYEHFKLKRSERLGGIGLLKRLGQELEEGTRGGDRPAFHSASHMAAAPLLTRIARRGAGSTVREYLDALGAGTRLRVKVGEPAQSYPTSPFGGVEVAADRTFGQRGDYGYDGTALFPMRLDDVFAESGAAGEAEAKKRLRRLLSELDASSEGPQPYYGILLADGDHMGRVIDGLGTVEGHQHLSRNLDAFAVSCAELVGQHAGSLVYAGGDDVLALVPLHTALACARALRDAFDEAMKKPIGEGGRRLEPDKRPTLSVGLAVAHHMTPMRESFDLARRAEKLAKQRRNSLAVMVDMRSGETKSATSAWSDDEGASDLGKRLDAWARLLDAEAIPDGAAYHLEALLKPFEPADARAKLNDRARFDAEIKSLALLAMARRRGERGSSEIDADAREALERGLAASGDLAEASMFDRVKALSTELQIARVFLRAYHDAWGNARERQADGGES